MKKNTSYDNGSRLDNIIKILAAILIIIIIITAGTLIYKSIDRHIHPENYEQPISTGIVIDKKDYIRNHKDVYEIIYKGTDEYDHTVIQTQRVTAATYLQYNIGDTFGK